MVPHAGGAACAAPLSRSGRLKAGQRVNSQACPFSRPAAELPVDAANARKRPSPRRPGSRMRRSLPSGLLQASNSWSPPPKDNLTLPNPPPSANGFCCRKRACGQSRLDNDCLTSRIKLLRFGCEPSSRAKFHQAIPHPALTRQRAAGKMRRRGAKPCR